MLPEIPARVWLVLLICLVALAPVQYICRHVARSPSRRDITLPPDDLSWRSDRRFALSLLSLTALASLCVFIFTPTAEDFARSPQLWPLLAGGLGVFAGWTAVRGYITGVIEPMIRGPSWEFRRTEHPKRYWSSMAWNALLGSGMIFVALSSIAGIDRDQCFHDDLALPERIAACDEALTASGLDASDRRDILTTRGWAHEQVGDQRQALSDYDRALALDNTGLEAFYYRGMLRERLGQDQLANEDYNSAILLDPEDDRVLFARGVFYLNQGNLPGALGDLNRADRLKPGDVWILANRGVTQAWLGNLADARRDLDNARAIDEHNEVILSGDAIVSFQSGNRQEAIQHLDTLLKIHPNNRWAKQFRHEVVQDQR